MLGRMKESSSGEGNSGIRNGDIMVTWMVSKKSTGPWEVFLAKFKAGGEIIF